MKWLSYRWLVGAAAAAFALASACSSGNPPNLGDSDSGVGNPLPGGGCSSGKAGCPCSPEGATADCGVVERRSGDYVTCSEGTATCTGGKWGACTGAIIYMKSVGSMTLGGNLQTQGLQTNPTSCDSDPCDPACTNYVDNGTGLDAGAGLQPSDSGGVTLVQEGGTCSGYQCQVVTCGGNAQTTLTGTVYDPAGLNPVYNAIVYVPVSLPLPAIPAGAQQDACGGGGNLPPAVAYAYTGPDGKFTLTGVPSGVNIPLVVQIGKWRRTQMLASVNQCVTTAVPTSQTRLPQNKTDGYNNQADLPQMAIVTGGCDPMECLVKRIGVSTSEFTSPGAGGKVDYYQAYGEPLVGGTNPQPSNLLGNLTTMMKEDLIMLPCDCDEEYYQYRSSSGRWSGNYTTFLSNIVSYTSNGGRLFSSHWGRQWLEGGGLTNPFPGIASWVPYGSSGGYDGYNFEGQINTSFQKGADFSTWMANAGATYAAGKFFINPTRYDTYSVSSAARLWVSYDGWLDYFGTWYSGFFQGPADFTFDTPLGAANQYGRVMFTDMHLASGFNTSSFPSECPTGGLTAQEKAAEFLLFDLGSCLTQVPPPPPAYYPATFTRDYEGQCPAGQKVVWRFFDWETHTPSDSNIVFTAQTSDTQAGLATATPVVNLGTASGAPITTYVGTDVGLALAPSPSLDWLRVTITLNPSSDDLSAPTLDAWRQQFDCADNQ
ncbi:MAG TPA: hypothetical protein VGH28_25340 [Polyangiaceae bacterium]|jgi:hypothetical protein